MPYECAARPSCPACGAEWDDEMVAMFDIVLGLGCSCCHPLAARIPEIACHKCKKVLYRARGLEDESASPNPAVQRPPLDDLDMTPHG